jgi:hypothetical protein
LFIVSGANIQQYIYFCKGFGGKSLFIGLLGGGLLGDTPEPQSKAKPFDSSINP